VGLLPLVKRVALQLRGHLPAHVELDDLIGAGTLGLLDAVRKFNPGKGVNIESYARYRIRGAILDSLREQDHASRDTRRKIKKIESTYQKLEFQLGRPASNPELAEALGLSLAEWYQTTSELERLGYEGAGANPSQEIRRRVDEESLIAADPEDSFTLCYRGEQRRILDRALGSLSERERVIIRFYYREALTMQEIATRLGIDESRVSQLHAGALARLRACVRTVLQRPVPLSTASWEGNMACLPD
jgi:RNA polymerase sigma factor FliA